MAHDHIVIKGARQHNLRIGEVRIPKKELVVFTGVSGSGKSSLAFDTLFAEGQRRYVESLSSYARQFLGQMDKPAYDSIQGLSPTIAIQQKAASSNPRSTVGTITEIHDYLRVLYARLGVQHCPVCGVVVEALSTDQIVQRVRALRGRALLLAPLVDCEQGGFEDLLARLRERGFARIRHNGSPRRLDEDLRFDPRSHHQLELVVDRLDPSTAQLSRLTDSVETALREGGGALLVQPGDEAESPIRLSQYRACPEHGVDLPELSPQAFSFNSPSGMCQACNGLGRQAKMDPDLVVADPSRSIRQGAIEPLASVMGRGSGVTHAMFVALEKDLGIDLDCPWERLPQRQRRLVLFGAGDQLIQVQWKSSKGRPASWAMLYEGVLCTLMRRYRETKSEDMREYYQRYLSEQTCADCGGARLRAESRAVRVAGKSIVDVSTMSVDQAAEHFRSLEFRGSERLIAEEVLQELSARLDFLCSVGLGYLTLDRSGPSLSGGEAQRIRLASQLGSELSGVIYVLDEPTIGLHLSDNHRLIQTLCRLRDADNTVIVVEHDAQTIESADHVIDFGPGAGLEGGRVVFSGTPAELKRSPVLTGQYLAGRARIELPRRRRSGRALLSIVGAAEHNLKSIDVAFPVGTLIAVTGVSGAGKSSLIAGILQPALLRSLHGAKVHVGRHSRITGLQWIDKLINIDQSPIGRTPRSNPATYTKCFDAVRELFALLPDACVRGYGPGRFSFNVSGGRCEACSGDGVRRVEMHFLPDVYVPCDVCHGKRYNDATLQVRFKGHNIAEVLELSVVEALDLFSIHPKLRRILQTLSDVGLGYIKLGQPATTLSGGEAQRVKLSRELARRSTGRTLYTLDEPTTGLHFEDIKKLLTVLDRLVAAGNTVIIIEHNLDVIKCADHVIDLGPGGGDAGGRVVATGTPEEVARHQESRTGAVLAALLRRGEA
jgi:excinuclease ABC subunit A